MEEGEVWRRMWLYLCVFVSGKPHRKGACDPLRLSGKSSCTPQVFLSFRMGIPTAPFSFLERLFVALVSEGDMDGHFKMAQAMAAELPDGKAPHVRHKPRHSSLYVYRHAHERTLTCRCIYKHTDIHTYRTLMCVGSVCNEICGGVAGFVRLRQENEGGSSCCLHACMRLLIHAVCTGSLFVSFLLPLMLVSLSCRSLASLSERLCLFFLPEAGPFLQVYWSVFSYTCKLSG